MEGVEGGMRREVEGLEEEKQMRVSGREKRRRGRKRIEREGKERKDMGSKDKK